MGRLPASLALFALVACALLPRVAFAAPSHDACTGFIDTADASVGQPGTWCLRKDLVTPDGGLGDGIRIDASQVVIDCMGHEVRFGGSAGNARDGVHSDYQRNVTVRNCRIVGFRYGIALRNEGTYLNRYTVEDNIVEDFDWDGIQVQGGGNLVRRNHVSSRPAATDAGATPVGIAAAGMCSPDGAIGGNVDIEDNTIEAISASAGKNAYGIWVSCNRVAGVRGNRIRALGGASPAAIHVSSNTRATIAGNDLLGDGIGTGVHCYLDPAGPVHVADNVIAGYGAAIGAQCTTVVAGDNDLGP